MNASWSSLRRFPSEGEAFELVEQGRVYQRLRNFACVCPPQQTKLLVYLKADPMTVDLVPGFTRDVTRLGHHGTGDLASGCRLCLGIREGSRLGLSVVRGGMTAAPLPLPQESPG